MTTGVGVLKYLNYMKFETVGRLKFTIIYTHFEKCTYFFQILAQLNRFSIPKVNNIKGTTRSLLIFRHLDRFDHITSLQKYSIVKRVQATV